MKIFKKIYTKACKRINEYELLDEWSSYYLFLFNNKYHVDILTHHWNGKRRIESCLKRLGIRKGIEYNEIIKGKKKKVHYDFNIFIDDNPEMIFDIVEYPHKYLLLYNSPWNKSYDCKPYRNVYRVHNWQDIFEKIQQLKKLF